MAKQRKVRVKRTKDGSVNLRTKKGKEIAEKMKKARAAKGKSWFSKLLK